jgi:hypothetical protein
MKELMQKAWPFTLLVTAIKLSGCIDAGASAAKPYAAKDDQGSNPLRVGASTFAGHSHRRGQGRAGSGEPSRNAGILV